MALALNTALQEKLSTNSEMNNERLGLPSASEFPRIVSCLGYLSFRRDIGPLPERDSEDAALGNKLHEILFNEGKGKDSIDDRSRWVVDKCLEIRDGIVKEIFGDNPVEVIKEQRHWMLSLHGDKLCSGKSDFIAIGEGGDAIVVNYKTANVESEASDDSWQLAMEVACLADDLAKKATVLKNIYAAIVQPMVSPVPTIVRYDSVGIHDLQMLVRRRLRESDLPNAPRTPGVQCKFCPLASHCPEGQAYAALLYDQRSAISVGALTPQQISMLLPKFTTIAKVMDQVKARAEELALAGQLPGYEMKPGYERTDITDIPGFFEAMKSQCGITREEFFRNLTVVKGGLEQLFRERWTVQHGGSKKSASERFDELARQFGETKQTKARLAPIKEVKVIE